MAELIKAKTLINKNTKEFSIIDKFNGKYEIFTSDLPKISPTTATIDRLIEYFKNINIDISDLEYIDIEIKVLQN